MKSGTLVLLAVFCVLFVHPANSDEDKKQETISLAEGKITLSAPAGWKKKQPRVRIITYEFSVPGSSKDVADGRFTVSRAGGSVKANIDRWVGMFSQPDGSPTQRSCRSSSKGNGVA